LAAARLVWALHFYGHGAAAVLDGGWDRWVAEERPVTDRAADVAPAARFRATPTPEVGADFAWLRERVGDEEVVLVDTRTDTEYAQGHLPGAKSWDWFNAVPAESWNVARDAEQLRADWRALGIDEEREVVVYCRSGMRAAHTYVALRNAGYERVRLYDGSWQDWAHHE
jgi:thiosulfate/3-mercaptopyruvate sulfurtransferase